MLQLSSLFLPLEQNLHIYFCSYSFLWFIPKNRMVYKNKKITYSLDRGLIQSNDHIKPTYLSESNTVFEDNNGAQNQKTCHAYVHAHVIQLLNITFSDLILNLVRYMSSKAIDTKEQLADIFTKPLPEPQFRYLREKLLGWQFKCSTCSGSMSEFEIIYYSFHVQYLLYVHTYNKSYVFMYISTKTKGFRILEFAINYFLDKLIINRINYLHSYVSCTCYYQCHYDR